MPAPLAQHPAVKHRSFQLTVAANTPEATALGATLALPNIVVDSMTVEIPGGHAGLTGIRFLIDGYQFLPWADTNTPRWFKGDDFTKTFAVGLPTNHNIEIRAFNTDDTFDHTFYCILEYRDQVDVVAAAEPAAAPRLTVIA